MVRNSLVFVLVGVCLCFPGLIAPVYAAPRMAVSAGDVIATVNALRANKGLAPYTIDSGMMAYAQEHADYMARNDRGTHQHSDGSMPSDRGVSENVASGTVGMMSAAFIVNTIWADPVHMNTMIGYTGGLIGVGVSSNGTNEYISLDVLPSGRVGSSGSSSGAGGSRQATSAPVVLIAQVVTATPRPDGSVVHVVGYGQSLWQIAITYGVKIDDIRALNGLLAGSTTIYEGQKLVIFPAGSVTQQPSPAPTATPAAVSPTPRPTATSRLPTAAPTAVARSKQIATLAPSRTAAPTPTNTPAASFLDRFDLDFTSILVGLVFGAAVILFVVFLLSFRK